MTRDSVKRAIQKYQQTEKFKESKREYYRKNRDRILAKYHENKEYILEALREKRRLKREADENE